MAAIIQTTKATNMVSAYTQLQRACDVFGLMHSADNEICLFRDHLPRHLSNAVNLAAKIFGGDAPLSVVARQQRGAVDAAALLRALSDCAQLANYMDLAFVSAVDLLVRNSQFDDVSAIRNLCYSDPVGATEPLNKRLQGLYHAGLRQHVIPQSLTWRKQAEEGSASVQSCVGNVFAAHGEIFACKADLLPQDRVPKSRTQASTLYDQLMHGQAFTHAEVGQVQSWQRAFHAALSESSLGKQKLLAWVYVTIYSRIYGPYTTAVLLFDGAATAPDEVHTVLQTTWNTATDGHGYCFQWPSSACQWAGRIESGDTDKGHKLLHGLECVALAEMYVRPRCLIDQPTFVVGSNSELNKE